MGILDKDISRRQALKLFGQTALVVCAAPAVFSLSGCGSGALAGYRPITDINDLDGRKVGVLCGWEPDLILTGRDDMTLCRYDTLGDMTMALCYRQIDAMCIDESQCLQVNALVDGVEILEPSIGAYHACTLWSEDCWDIGVDFDDWLKNDFGGSSRQEDIQYRKAHVDENGNFIPAEVPYKKGSRNITVGVDLTYYPDCFQDAETGEIRGTITEVMRWFAYDRDYEITFIDWSTDTQATAALTGKIDCSACCITDYYYDMIIETYPDNYCSHGFLAFNMNLVQISDRDSLAIKGELE